MRFLLAIFLLISPCAYADEVSCGDLHSYLVFDVNNREILSEQQADVILYPASLTKVMTLYLTFDALKKGKLHMNQKLKFSAYGEEVSHVNEYNTTKALEGDEITVREAILALIVKSFNEAAVTLAEAIAGDEWKFSQMMNKKAQEIGMINTSFRNSSGLHEEGQYTTGYDMARLAIAIKKDFPRYYHLFAKKKFTYNGVEYVSHNKITLAYDGAEGMKTGYTSAAGFNLISVARRGGKRVGSILLSCADSDPRYELSANLLDSGFEDLKENFYVTKIDSDFSYAVPE